MKSLILSLILFTGVAAAQSVGPLDINHQQAYSIKPKKALLEEIGPCGGGYTRYKLVFSIVYGNSCRVVEAEDVVVVKNLRALGEQNSGEAVAAEINVQPAIYFNHKICTYEYNPVEVEYSVEVRARRQDQVRIGDHLIYIRDLQD